MASSSSSPSSNNDNKVGYKTTPGSTILVTGSSGFVGARLVEMLLERGAAHVLCFDITPPSSQLLQRFTEAAGGDDNGNGNGNSSKSKSKSKFTIFSGDGGNLTNQTSVQKAFASVPQIDVVYHIAALVGPFHEKKLYTDVNYNGTLHILHACRQHTVPRLVFSSSPSTRFTGDDIEGLREEELVTFPETFLAEYAQTKAMAEMEVTKACDAEKGFMTINVAPHQVYGPHDPLFLPALLETAGSGKLRIFGRGRNKISVCFVDNYCHGLICGADVLQPTSAALGKFYIITDGPEVYFWKILNSAIVSMGFTDLEHKFHLPKALLFGVAYFCNFLGWVLGRKFKLNPFNVKMLTIHRYFSIENARRDLMYEPLYTTEEAWGKTVEWHKKFWLPGYLERVKLGKGSAVIGNDKKTR